jgi:stage IV sporulation protein B
MIENVEDVERYLNGFLGKKPWVDITLKREGKLIQSKIKPVLTRDGKVNNYMLGIFIEDPAAGVGTLSFYNPKRHSFAGLGHQIANLGGRNGVRFQYGEIVLANISSVRMGIPGKPGEKIGIFNTLQNPVGKITKNCRFGIYGEMYPRFNELIRNDFFHPIPMAYNSQIHEGPGTIYTVVKGSKIEEFQVKIIKVYTQHAPRDKGLVVKVTDPRLLRETGGIIQGMSGSPIIQDGRLVGAVTHVFVNDPTKGYGVLAEWMIQEMNKKYIKPKKAS